MKQLIISISIGLMLLSLIPMNYFGKDESEKITIVDIEENPMSEDSEGNSESGEPDPEPIESENSKTKKTIDSEEHQIILSKWMKMHASILQSIIDHAIHV